MTDETIASGRSRRASKSASAFRTISEVADELGLEQHVLRFWETKFTQIKPMKRGGGRRYYRPEDVVLLEKIRDLLRGDGYTIKGVQKLLKEGHLSKDKTPDPVAAMSTSIPSPELESLAAKTPATSFESPPRQPQASSDRSDEQEKLRSVLRELQELRDMASLVVENKL